MRQVIVDTREKRPWEFDGSVRRALPAGDYSLVGLEDRLTVERKSLVDLVGTLTAGWPRFKRELEKLAQYKCAAMVIEASKTDVSAHCYAASTPPAAIFKRLSQVEAAAPDLCVIWGGHRGNAKLKALAFLQRGEEILCPDESLPGATSQNTPP